MPQPEAPAARSGATQGTAYSESAFNGASMPTPIRSLYPKLAFFISLLGSIILRFAVMATVFFTQPGLMVAMLVLLPSTLMLLVSAASRRNPAGS